MSVGRLDENKNHRMLLEAFAQIVKEIGKDAEKTQPGKAGKVKNTLENQGKSDKSTEIVKIDWIIQLYGDGPLRAELQEYANKLGIDQFVRFEGLVSNVADRIAKAAIYVQTSDAEGMPNALMESMALGLACISTDCPCGGPAMLIEDGVDGCLVPVGDAGALAARLRTLMEDEQTARQIGAEAANKIRSRYNPAMVCREWEEYLESKLR